MNAKYLSKAVALPKDVHAQLETVREELTGRFGFAPSLTETIQFLIKEHNEKEKAL